MSSDLGDNCIRLLEEGVSKKELSKLARETEVSIFGSVPGTNLYEVSALIEGAVKIATCLAVGYVAGKFLGGAYCEFTRDNLPLGICETVGSSVISLALGISTYDFHKSRYIPGSRAYNHDLMDRILRERYGSILGKRVVEVVVESKSD